MSTYSVVAQLRVVTRVIKGAFQREAQMTQCKGYPARSILPVLTNTDNITDSAWLILMMD